MINKFYQFFLWIKDHCSLLVVVLLRLYVGKEKETKSKQKQMSNEDAQRGDANNED